MATHSNIVVWRIPQTGAWQATVHRVAELDLIEATKHACTHMRFIKKHEDSVYK